MIILQLVGGTTAYAVNELYKTITKDENHDGSTTKNHTTEEFKDKQGRVVLKRTYADIGGVSTAHDTYYVYDDYGNLTFVLPPKMDASTNDIITINNRLDDLGYRYKYDQRNRLVEKKIQGKSWEYIVYNKLDQPVMTQDSILHNQGKWLFTKYDAYGRVAYTGFKNSTGSRDYFQNLIDTHATATQYESKVSSGTGYLSTYYSSTAIPQSVTEIYTINYYDNYYFNNDGLTVPVNGQYDTIISGSNTKGLATGSKVIVLGSTSWITTVMGYDQDRRPIWIGTKNNYLSTTDYIESKLKDNTDDISGLLRETKTTHQKTGKTDIVTIEKFTYDHSGKLLTQTHNINSQGEETIATNEDDDLGQLKRKKIGNNQSTGCELQVVDYRYNIRGWLKEINEVDNLGSTDLFAFKINYNNPTSGTALFNGNISQSHWNSASINNTSNPESTQYTYAYDALNRIVSAIDNTTTQNYSLQSISYDKNGNITNLERKGHTNTGATNFGVMDDLTYSYDSGNKLMKVADAATIDQFGFKDDAVNGAADTSNDYTYDINGNLLTDTNKGITSILYNHLNLPTEIKFDNSNTKKINYTYDAAGIKLKKVVNDGGNLTTTDYVNGYIYENNTLQFFNHPEGYVHNDNGTFKYVYNYVDHLGSIRLSYSDGDGNGSISQSEIIKENHYYPYGLKMRGFNTSVSSLGNSVAKKYMFNGKEFDDSFNETLNTYDFGARNYDPALGRWMNMDPLADQFPHQSPYSAMNNNPIYFIDPDGRAAVSSDWVPDSDGNLIAESGDNAQTLADYQGVSYSEGLKQLTDQGYTVNSKGILNLKIGDKVELDNVYTRNLSSDANLPNGSSQLNYNCWGSSCAGSDGKDIKVGVGIDAPVAFDNILKNDYKSVNSTDAKFGETILRFTTNKPYAGKQYDAYEKAGLLSRDPNAVGGSLHGAVFYGRSKNGTTYIYTKNGWNEAPRIMKLKNLENNTYYNYGTVRGLNGKSGTYNKN